MSIGVVARSTLSENGVTPRGSVSAPTKTWAPVGLDPTEISMVDDGGGVTGTTAPWPSPDLDGVGSTGALLGTATGWRCWRDPPPATARYAKKATTPSATAPRAMSAILVPPMPPVRSPPGGGVGYDGTASARTPGGGGVRMTSPACGLPVI